MLKKIIDKLPGTLLLILAFCAAVFIGKEKLISILAIIVLLIELGYSSLLLKKIHKLQWLYFSAIVVEILFLVTEEFWFLVLSILLLLVASIWKVFFSEALSKASKTFLVIRKGIFSIIALLVAVFLAIDIYAKPITKPVKLPAYVKAEVDNNLLDSSTNILKNIQVMNSFGSRTTGSKGHNNFVSWLEQQVEDMGFTINRDKYTFNRWEEKKSSLLIEQEEIHVASAFPYSGETAGDGITGELVYTKPSDYEKARGKIAVVEIENFKSFPNALIMNERAAFPEGNKVVSGEGDLVLTTALKSPKLEEAKKEGVKAVILVWKGVSDEKTEKQYLPFTTDYVGIPAVWVNETEGQKVIGAAKESKKGTVKLEAEMEKDASTESFYVKIDGKNSEEAIIVNTHTDGVNVVEEDGAVGMLSMLRYFQKEKPERTMIFAFVTGHFRLPDFKGTSQATSTWLMDHPELWDGKEGHLKAVAGITVEHLGSMEWKEDEAGNYGPTGNISTEYTYVGNEFMGSIWKKAIENRSNNRSVILRGHNKFEFGESQPLFEAGIPVIGLIQMPDYLTVNSESREMDKFNVDLMHDQLESLVRATKLVDATKTKDIGKSDGYSFFFGRTK
jgi:hypothetical protein